ncbi:MAG: DUF2971 domain-containing protein [Deltaproteobacteria bacterium]|nr:DUF2971 domain-containing protein [Deltaproteobacteria bacterium]
MESQELEGIFTKREIFLPKPIDFNDPFECRPKLTVYNSGLKRQQFIRARVRNMMPCNNRKARKALMRDYNRILRDRPEHIDNAYERFLETTGLYCLSEKKDDILMWSHYSSGHKGLCIEFDPILDARIGGMILFGQALKVIYSEERPIVNVMAFVMASDQPTEYKKALLTKSNHWEYEEEWRVIKTEREGGPGIRHFRPEILTGVIFGALISPENKQKIMEWVSRYPTKIVLYQAIIDETKYKLNIEPI